jgi:hypothetical protein
MMACAEMCRTSAHFMLIDTPHHKHTCGECAEICTECAQDCERIAAWTNASPCAGRARSPAAPWRREGAAYV